ncbi:unnamed protein product, partial [Amoebophrya sp. A120]|eukprot:GSA120T00015442001.1
MKTSRSISSLTGAGLGGGSGANATAASARSRGTTKNKSDRASQTLKSKGSSSDGKKNKKKVQHGSADAGELTAVVVVQPDKHEDSSRANSRTMKMRVLDEKRAGHLPAATSDHLSNSSTARTSSCKKCCTTSQQLVAALARLCCTAWLLFSRLLTSRNKDCGRSKNCAARAVECKKTKKRAERSTSCGRSRATHDPQKIDGKNDLQGSDDEASAAQLLNSSNTKPSFLMLFQKMKYVRAAQHQTSNTTENMFHRKGLSANDRRQNVLTKIRQYVSDKNRQVVDFFRSKNTESQEVEDGTSYSFKILIIKPINHTAMVFLLWQALMIAGYGSGAALWVFDRADCSRGRLDEAGVEQPSGTSGATTSTEEQHPEYEVPLWFGVLYSVFVILPVSLYVSLVVNAVFLALIFSWLLRERIFEQLGQLRLLGQIVGSTDFGRVSSSFGTSCSSGVGNINMAIQQPSTARPPALVPQHPGCSSTDFGRVSSSFGTTCSSGVGNINMAIQQPITARPPALVPQHPGCSSTPTGVVAKNHHPISSTPLAYNSFPPGTGATSCAAETAQLVAQHVEYRPPSSSSTTSMMAATP